MKCLYFFLVISSLFVISCSPEESFSTIEIVIKGKYKNEPLVFAPGFKYDYFDGSKISFTKSEFFISNLELIHQGIHSLPYGDLLKHVKLQNHHISIDKSNEGYKITISDIATGNFDGIKFGIGLEDELNSTDPSKYSITSVLGDSENYWSGWNSYIFSKTEGVLENTTQNTKFAYHSGTITGFPSAYRTIEIKKPFQLIDGQTTKLVLEMDHSKIFGNTNDFINIYDNNIFHDGSDFMTKFMDQIKVCFN